MKKKRPTVSAAWQFVPGRQYRGLHGKVVDWVEHKFEEGLLYIHVRFVDKTELCWRVATRMTIEEGDLSDWKSGDFKQLRVFVRNERDRSVRCTAISLVPTIASRTNTIVSAQLASKSLPRVTGT